jgi:hypothetical protein
MMTSSVENVLIKEFKGIFQKIESLYYGFKDQLYQLKFKENLQEDSIEDFIIHWSEVFSKHTQFSQLRVTQMIRCIVFKKLQLQLLNIKTEDIMKNQSLISKIQVIQRNISFKSLGIPEKYFSFNILIQVITCKLRRALRDRTLVRTFDYSLGFEDDNNEP